MIENQIHTYKGNVLIVDDSPENLHILVKILNDHGYKVRPVHSGSQALLVARSTPPDLILLDTLMQEMNSYEVCQQLKASAQTRDIPVIFISAMDKVLDKVKAFSIGGVDYITKPFQIEEVIARVETHLSLRNLQKSFQEKNEHLRQEIKKREKIEQVLQKRVDELAQAQNDLLNMMADIEIANHQANVAKEMVEQANRTKSEFLANINHEIRTPMNAIMGFTQLALNTALSNKQRSYLTRVHSSSQSLLEIITALLDLSKIEASKLSMKPVNFCLDDVLNYLSNLLKVKIEEKGLALRITIEKNVPRYLVGDSLRLRQILLHLITNAIKFTEKGYIVIKVKLIATKNEQVNLHFSVKDTGIGISKKIIPYLFDAFTQVDGSSTRKFGGSGLGLAICEPLTKMMGGEIWVKSQPGKGSTFNFNVVLSLQVEPPNDVQCFCETKTSNSVLHEEIDTTTTAKNIKGKRILLVEDNRINQQMTKKMIECQDLVVDIADSGKKAVAMVAETDFDAVLMDVQMPGMNGYEATQLIRKKNQHNKLPVIAMTANAMSGDREKCLAAGMDDYIAKPINMEQLFATLEKWITQKKGNVIQVKSPTFETDNETLPDETLLPDKLPGIDVSDGIKKLLGNRQLYLELLQEFYHDYQDAAERMKNLLEEGDSETAKRFIHSLKGISGNLSINSLYQVSKDFEKALMAGDDISEPFKEFEFVMSEVMKTLLMVNG